MEAAPVASAGEGGLARGGLGARSLACPLPGTPQVSSPSCTLDGPMDRLGTVLAMAQARACHRDALCLSLPLGKGQGWSLGRLGAACPWRAGLSLGLSLGTVRAPSG
jgi:hypothetical protein